MTAPASEAAVLGLKPCASCGSPAEWVPDFMGEGHLAGVSCTECRACMIESYAGIWHHKQELRAMKERLIAEWNRQTEVKS